MNRTSLYVKRTNYPTIAVNKMWETNQENCMGVFLPLGSNMIIWRGVFNRAGRKDIHNLSENLLCLRSLYANFSANGM